MTTLKSMRGLLLATAVAAILSLGCGEGVEGDAASASLEQMEASNNGQCNAIIARGLRSAQQCFRDGCAPGSDACDGVTGAFLDFFQVNSDCGEAFFSGEADGLAGSAIIHPQTGALKHVGEVICSSVAACGLCGTPGVCDGEGGACASE